MTKSQKFLATTLVLMACLTSPKKVEAPTVNRYYPPKFKTEISIPAPENIDYKTENFYQDSDRILLARMLLGEAESCPALEKIAIAYTAINRMHDGKDWNGTTLQEVLLKPRQYSCFNPDISARLKNPMARNPKVFLECLRIAEGVLNRIYVDPTNRATHYLNPNHPDLRGKPLPSWTKTLEEIGRINNGYHVFYK